MDHRVHKKSAMMGSILTREKLCCGSPEASKASTGHKEGVGAGVNGQDKESSAEVSCGPGIVLAFQSFLECGLCSIGIRGGERCDQS